MRTLQDIPALREVLGECRRRGQRIGLVPTMGNLHEGHLALVAAARRRADVVVATVFVNPLQFGPNEDLDAYPRTLADDQAKLEAAGCDLLFTPSVATLYPRGLNDQTRVCVPGVSEGLCGGSRPGHFDGVSTVVSILFNLVQPDVACFGEKDYQQLAVIRKLVDDLHFPIEIVGVPIERADDGLALSSRNGYLDEAERATAPELQRTLAMLREKLEAGEPVDATLAAGLTRLREAGFVPDYLELRAADLGPVSATTREAVLLTAARLGTTRLIDNLTLTLPR
ncbi:pantoate--beta-alanine ligase [Halomonas sp. MCCC 1A17488]|uniref:Pantothenate synthetase n=1 Tax=Billgrantia sulfidoxydans TaxID=2733484 RepID=A0ABX7WA15_9GAMM|nr:MULTISPECIES: pantoate--beta-alanine ligase [Halomonas]MCE8017493.1 pantoate--beta-alanine ligase [Halomonas sp. MCCC 1A17488]MCG3240826.1 pantoate--beta-alanine ligase [Halomonas sp. MCCC 1A17488]QPP49343.1 pantoate--beta-alanine ligase [Halomonas sp. SS10-MC5]QTP56700.1 pantoate--beta-alanine ligase [Halomonas sulfidoxydans]